MKISESWLREWVNPEMDTASLTHILTMAGLEVDGVEPAAEKFTGIVVGGIKSIDAHPDAEKLRVCQVSDGSDTYQVVCGASNAAAGMRIPFAKVGAVLPSGMEIKQAKLRGVESLGMLCGASELGLEDMVDGLMVLASDAPLGSDVRDYLNLDDAVIEVDLTPNRGDCLSVLGIAREIGVLASTDVIFPALNKVAASISDTVPVSLQADDYCPRYAGRVIRDVDMSQPTPLWMREKLRRAGLRSIDAVVDVTNYVMLELGQPLHAFDLDAIDGAMSVRRATAGEKIKLLDDSELSLNTDMLVIADTKKALAIAGIMGGNNSAVSSSTQHILLEAAFFVPHLHAGKARSLGMHTDASHRFERGVDALGQERAIERATQLLMDIVGGNVGPILLTEAEPKTDSVKTVELPESQIMRVLGFEMPEAQVTDILTRLDLSPARKASGWQITVPSHRFDIAIEADLLEELARVYGYDNLPVEPPLAPMTFSLNPESNISAMSFRQHMIALGYNEAITYSFIDPAIHRIFFDDVEPVSLANPIASDMSVMRTSLMPGLVAAAKYNLSRQQKRLRLFETGLAFIPESNGVGQRPLFSGLICGERADESWLSKRESVQAPAQKSDAFDFYDIKADVESLLAKQGISQKVEFQALNTAQKSNWLHPGQSAVILAAGQQIGVIGQLHPQLQKKLDVSSTIWAFELQLNLISEKKVPKFKELSKFPEVRRDLAVIVDQQLNVSDVVAQARQAAGPDLIGLVIFDQYSGEGVGEGMQSLGLGLTWQHSERTMNDEEIAGLTEAVIAVLKEQFNASLR